MSPFNIPFALCGCVFFSIYAILMTVYGDHTVRIFALLALFLGGLSQFLAQDERVPVAQVALYTSHIGMIIGFFTLIRFAFFSVTS
jgi:hypothetical protein